MMGSGESTIIIFYAGNTRIIRVQTSPKVWEASLVFPGEKSWKTHGNQ
jgi:hypothetical protein